jgi:AcrR family transcriptional regulator
MAREASSNQGGPDVGDRILATASDLFYQHGIRAVGVDLVVKKVGAAKTSLCSSTQPTAEPS